MIEKHPLQLKSDIAYPILTILVVFMSLMSWQSYLSPMFLDQAREIITSYFIDKGLIAYKDFPYYYGPIGPYFVTAIVKLFGFNFITFYFIGYFTVLINSFVLYRIGLFVLNSFQACLVSVLFITQIAFNSMGSFIFPYSYSAIIAHLVFSFIVLFICHYHKSLNNVFIYLNSVLICVLLFIKQDFFIASFIIQLLYLVILPFLKLNSNITSLKDYLNSLKIKILTHFILILLALTAIIYSICIYIFGFIDFNSGMFPFQVSNSLQVIYHFLTVNFGLIFVFKASISLFIIFVLYSLLYLMILWMTSPANSIINILTKILIYLILFLSLFLFVDKFFHLNLIDFTLNYILLFSNEIYTGSGLWLIIFLLCTAFLIKKDIKYQFLLILTISSILVSFRSFFDRPLTSYPLFYLPLTLIFFVYIVVEIFPKLINLISDKLSQPHKNVFNYTSLVTILFIAGLYLSIDLTLFKQNKYTINTPLGSHKEFSLEKYHMSKLTMAASEYVKKNTKSTDKILVYPSLSLVYLYSDRLPASKYFDLFDTIIFSKKEELLTISKLNSNKPKYILLTSDNFNSICNSGAFCAVQNSDALLQWIKSNYHIETKFHLKNLSWLIYIYKKN